jgi:hypothetical protein
MDLSYYVWLAAFAGAGLAVWRAGKMRPEYRGRIRVVAVPIVGVMFVLWYLLRTGSI